MSKIIFISAVLLQVSLAQADCLELVKNTLSTQNTLIVDPTLKRTQKEFDSVKIKKKQADLTAKFVYNRPDVFDQGEDFDILAVEEQLDFTHVIEYTKGPMQLRTYENKKSGQTAGLRLSSGKRMAVFPVRNCQMSEFTLVSGGARCFFKKADCQHLNTITSEKMKAKCSFFTDLSDSTLQLVNSSCQALEKDNSPVVARGSGAETKPSQKENTQRKGTR